MSIEVIARDRGDGKTTALVGWLLDGHRIDGWPGWSRLLVVADGQRVQAIHNGYAFPEQDHALRAAGCEGGLGKVVVTLAEAVSVSRRGLARDVEWALDDVETVLADVFGVFGLPAVLTVTGVAR